MISLAECAPCKAMRLQAESEEEFRKRYGMVDLNKTSQQMGWTPYYAKMPTQPVYLGASAETSAPNNRYLANLQQRLMWFAGGTLFGLPLGLLSNVAFKSLRKYRSEAATFVAIATGVGLLASILPIDSPVMATIARISGVLAGSAASDVILPRKITAPLPV